MTEFYSNLVDCPRRAPTCLVASNVLDSIGNTPLIRLRNASAETGCDIYARAEFLNPGGSIKDRVARHKDIFRPRQFANPDNIEAHRLTTGVEILRQAQRPIDAFVMAIGTGGTIPDIVNTAEFDQGIRIKTEDAIRRE